MMDLDREQRDLTQWLDANYPGRVAHLVLSYDSTSDGVVARMSEWHISDGSITHHRWRHRSHELDGDLRGALQREARNALEPPKGAPTP